MLLDTLAQAFNGPLPVKLALAAVLVVAFLFLRRRETEGAMGGYALLGGLFIVRDLAFAFFPLPVIYQASDFLVFGILLFIALRPFQPRLTLWLPLAAEFLGLALLVLSQFAFFPLVLPAWLPLAALFVPVAAAALVPLLRRAEADTPGRLLALRSALPLAIGSVVYIAALMFVGPMHMIFQHVGPTLFYGLLFLLGLNYVDISHEQLVGAVEYYEESVDSLFDLLNATGAAMKPDFSQQDVLDNMIRAVVERTGAEGGILLLSDEFEETVSVRAIHGTYPPPFKLPENLPRSADRVSAFVRHARFKLGEGILGEVARTGKHVFAPDPAEAGLPSNGDDEWLRHGGLIVAPLIVRDRIIGAISVAKTGGEPFTERDFDRCKLLANFGSIAVANSFTFMEATERSDIEREAAIAEEIQRTLAPKKLPELPRLSFGAFSTSARGVCSDHYDVIQTRSDRAVLLVGDVAGKGVAAGLVMVMIHSILHLITASTKDAATLLQWVNRGITGQVDLDHFATLSLVAVDAGTGTMEFANAGHQPLLIYRASSDSVESVDLKSVPIGVERGTNFGSKPLAIRPGDLLVMYTDGIIEAMNSQGRQYGLKNLTTMIQKSHDLAAREIASKIRADILEFCGHTRQHDDQTVLIMKAKS